MPENSTKYVEVKEVSNNQDLPIIQRANFRAYLDGYLELYDIFTDLRMNNPHFALEEKVKKLFDEVSRRPQ